MDGFIKINGAKIHNFKNIDVKIPKNKFIVITVIKATATSSSKLYGHINNEILKALI